MPHRSSVPLFWRIKKSKYNLVGNKCITCDVIHFPPRTFCPICRRRGKLVEHTLSGRGEVISFTEIHTAPDKFESNVPYIIGIVQLEEGPTVAAQIVSKDVKIGTKVRAVFRRVYEDGPDGLIYYSFKFEPI